MSRHHHLADLLQHHQGVDARERNFAEQMTQLLARAPRCFDRDHFEPGHFTASAFVLSPNKAEVLLIFHGKLHRWLQPGGHVDPEDPDILEAAKREVAEEVGIDGAGLDLLADGIFDIDVHEIPARKQDPKHSHFDVRFLFRAHSLQMCAGSDAKDARWVPLDQIDGVEQDASVMRAVQKIRQRLPFAVSTG